MITLNHVFILLGLFLAAIAILSAIDRDNPKRIGNAAFWGLFAASFLFGSYLGDFANGLLVLALVGLGGFGLLGKSAPPTTTPEERRLSAETRGNWLFLPALLIPIVALTGTLTLKHASLSGVALLDGAQVTLISLALGVIAALGLAMVWLRPPVLAPLQEGRRLIDSVGWAAILPQLLAALGAIFTRAGVGHAVGDLATRYLPLGQPFEAVMAYCLGMAMFTFVMGNAFAAFPVMTAAIGLPLIVHKFGGNPAIMGAIGMLSGFCGTLVTPMAANFNLVPTLLLDIKDPRAVIRAQIPIAAVVFVANLLLLYGLVYHMR
jgi:uncharacterized membrane protein